MGGGDLGDAARHGRLRRYRVVPGRHAAGAAQPGGLQNNQPITIEVAAPFAGETAVGYHNPDRDVLLGSEGSDLLFGGEDVDRLDGKNL